jgi:hypothetical protein
MPAATACPQRRHLRLRRAGPLVVLALLVAGLPGGADASPAPAGDEHRQALPRGGTAILWVDEPTSPAAAFAPGRLRFADTEQPPPPGEPLQYLSVWHYDPEAMRWRVWRSGWPSFLNSLHRLETGERYLVLVTADLTWGPAPSREPSVFERAQVVTLYGYPGVPIMGILGTLSPEAATIEAEAWAARYDALAEDLDVVPGLHLIVAVAQRHAGADGTYLGRMRDDLLEQYVEVTRSRDQLLFLDVQIGWSDPLTEARRLERWLREPHVHLALDPEFATRQQGVAPGRAIGTVTGAEVNEVQRYLADLVERYALPPKILVVHQFRDDMITRPADIEHLPGVDLVIDMDGFGPRFTKLWGYERYALSDYAMYAGFKLFFDWDTPLMSPEEIQALPVRPNLIIYQ